MKNIQPLDERILVEPFEKDSREESLIKIPEAQKEKPVTGVIVKVGTDGELQGLLKPGDKIIFGKYAGEEIEVGETNLLLITRGDVLATFED